MAVGGGGGGTGTGTGVGINKGPTSAAGVKVLRLSEYDELPPPPAHMMSSVTLTNAAAVSVNTVGDYVNCVGNGVGDSSGGGGGSGSGGISSDDNISEEGKLLACVRDDSVTYASASDLEPPATQLQLPPLPPPPPSSPSSSSFSLAKAMPDLVKSPTNVKCVAAVGRAPQAVPEVMQLSPSSEHQDLVSPLAPVTVTVHTNEAHIASSSTPRCLRRADSGVPQEALTPRSDTTSTGTESTTSPPERAPSESSSGVHSGEERDVEVVIRPRVACKPPAKPPPPAIQEEPYGRCTNMRMSSFASGGGSNATSATLPLQRSGASEQRYDYTQHCSTMPLPAGCHSQQQQQQQQGQQQQFAVYATSVHGMLPHSGSNVSSFKSQMYANSAVAMAGYNAQHQQPPLPPPPHLTHTTLPNGVRYSNPHFLRRLAHVSKAAESPYGHLGLGAGHHAFSKLAYDPLQTNLATTSIPEDRDSANYSMSSDQDCLYATANNLH